VRMVDSGSALQRLGAWGAKHIGGPYARDNRKTPSILAKGTSRKYVQSGSELQRPPSRICVGKCPTMWSCAGAWRLRATWFVDQQTGDRCAEFDADVFGSAVFDPNGRMTVLITSGARTKAESDSDSAAFVHVDARLQWKADRRRREARHASGWCLGPNVGRDGTHSLPHL